MAARYPYQLRADSPEGRRKEMELTGDSSLLDTPSERDVRKGFVYKRVPHVTLKSIAQNPDIREGITPDEINAAIARHADNELLVDQPYEDRKRVLVAGPFTVESLSPHRVLDDGDEQPVSEQTDQSAGSFVDVILANLRKAGVQNTKKGERLTFDRLDLFAGEWIQAEGEFTDAAGDSKRVAI